MLRNSCGYKLANDGIDTRATQDWLGHVSITHTTRYTALSSGSLQGLLAELTGALLSPERYGVIDGLAKTDQLSSS
jgi:integrase